MKKRLLAGFLAAVILLTLCPMTALAAENTGLSYLDCDTNGQNWMTKTCSEYTAVDVNSTTWSNGWYVVSGTVAVDSRITVTGTVHLILMNGCKLTASQGIEVLGGASLTIYAQSTEETTMGQLNAVGSENKAGIGGSYTAESRGAITINGGRITAQGGNDAAGIGGNANSYGGDVTINDGIVQATGGNQGSGIGPGFFWGPSPFIPNVTIRGGIVTSNEGGGVNKGSGIGGSALITGENGSALIFATSISDKKSSDQWNTIIFEGSETNVAGQVYGNVTIAQDLTVPDGVTLTIPESASLTIPEDTTLTIPGNATLNISADTALTVNGTAEIGNGGSVQLGSGPKITVPEGGTVTNNGGVKPIDNIVQVDGNTVTVPDNGEVKPTQGGGISVPGGSTIQTKESGPTITLPASGGEVKLTEGDGVIVPGGSTVKTGDTTIILPETGSSEVKPDTDGTITIPAGSTVQNADGTSTVLQTGGTFHPTTGNVEELPLVSFLDSRGENKTLDQEYHIVTNQTSWGTQGRTTWYLVDSDQTISDRITVKGDVHLILKDGHTLTASEGIAVLDPNSLTVYCQSGRTGALIANNPSGGGAAIGANKGTQAGSITINGGNIAATVSNGGGACIGMGGWSGGAGSVTVNGGNLKLTCNAGSEGAFGGNGTRQINGGVVEYKGSVGDQMNSTTMKDCIVFKNDAGKVYGSVTLKDSYTIPEGKTLTVLKDASLTIPEGVPLTNNGTILRSGTINGTVTGNQPIDTAVFDGTLNLRYGSIAIRKNDDGRIRIEQDNLEPRIVDAGTSITVTSGGEETPNTITVEGTEAKIILSDVKQGGGDGWPCPLSLRDGANVSLALQGENTLAASGHVSQGIEVWENCSLTVNGPGTLNIGSEGTYVGIGIGGIENPGSVTINSGTLNINARNVGIGAEMMMPYYKEDPPSITINGGMVHTNVSNGYGVGIGTSRAYEGGMNIAINGGTVELTGDGNKISAKGEDSFYPPGSETDSGSVTITGGSIQAGDISPTPTDGKNNPVHAVTVETGKTGAEVGGIALSGTEGYGSPAKTDGAGNLTLYLPAGEYTGAAVIGGEVVKLSGVKSEAPTEGSTSPSGTVVGTGVHVTTPEGTKPTVAPDGGVTVPDGGSVTVTDNEGKTTTITPPAGGGEVRPTEDGTVEISGGSTAQTGNGPAITVGDKGGTVKNDGGVTVPEGGSVTVKDSEGNSTTITPPAGGEVKPTQDGGVTVPGGSTVQTKEDGPTITLPSGGGEVKPTEDGGVTVPGGSIIKIGEDGPTITLPESGGEVKPAEDGGLSIPGGSTIQAGNGPEIIVGEKGGTVKDDGGVAVPEGGSVTVTDNEGKTTTITPPPGGEVKPTQDGNVSVPGGSTVKKPDGTEVIVGAHGGTVSSSGSVTNKPDPDPPVPPAPVAHTVTFDSQGGSTVSSITVTHGEKVAKPGDPTRSGYTFGGWYKEISCTTAWIFDTDTVAGDMTLYAKWTQNSGGGSSSGGDSSGGGSSYTPPTYPPVVEQPSEGGSVAVSPSRPERGDTVTVKPKPDTGYEVDKVTVTDRDGKPVEVTAKPDGTYTFTQPGGRVKIEVTYKPVETSWPNPFADVAEGEWYYDAVRFVSESGLMGGYGDGLFGVNDNLSRAQLAQILFNKEGRPVVNDLLQYGDVATGTWYTEAVRWATSQGIVGGYGNGKFGPDDDITREQLAAMLWRYAGSPAATDKELHFNDTDEISGFALEALRWAVEKGILNGCGDGRLGPKGLASRAQVAEMLKNYLEKQVYDV